MLNIGAGEIALIMVVALLILGPRRLPELARGIGKFMREFRRQTDEVRSTLETEFYRMDQDLTKDLPKAPLSATIPALARLPAITPDPKTANALPQSPTAGEVGAAPVADGVDDETVARTLGPAPASDSDPGHGAFKPPYSEEHELAGDPQDAPPTPPGPTGGERS